MSSRRNQNLISSVKTFSVNKAFIVVLLSSLAALLFVHKEVVLDKTSRNVKTLQMKTSKLQVEIAEAQITLDKMRSFPKISGVASAMDLYPMKTKPLIYSLASSEIPIEFSKKIEPLKPESGEKH